MAWRGTTSLRCFDARDDHSAQPLLTHSDRTAQFDQRVSGHADQAADHRVCAGEQGDGAAVGRSYLAQQG